MTISSKASICIILFTSIFGKLAGESTIYHIPPSPPTMGNSVSFEAIISIDLEVNEAIFFYRMHEQQSYKEKEMVESLGGTWTATISKVPEGDGIEYFFFFDLQDGSSMVLPEDEPNQNPFTLPVTATISKEKNNFLILSPEENDIVYSDAVLVMVSLYNIPEIDIGSVQLYLDKKDITADALITPDIVTYAPENVDPGIKMFTINASTNNGSEIGPFHHTISVISSEKERSQFRYSINGKSGVSMDQVAMDQGEDEKLNIYQTDLSLKAGWPRLKFKSKLKITSEESPFKQPKNRYSATVESGRFLKISLGDFMPSLSPYTINGKRVRGVGTDWRLGWLQFQSVHGELDRAMQGLNNTDRSYEISNVFLDNTEKVIYELDRRGYTFRNDLSSYRLALNIRDKIIFGSTLMRTKNDIKSVDRELSDASFTVSHDATFETAAQLDTGIYTFSEFQNLIAEETANYDYELSERGWGGNKPKQNLVLGTDFRLALDEHKFLLEGYWAISLLNKDIWDGTMTLAELDTLMEASTDANGHKIMDGKIMGMIDTLSMPDPTTFTDWMTLNLNLVPIIPIDINAFGDSASISITDAILSMPSSAYNLKFRSLYFNNMFELQYSQVGPEFTSLANPYFPKNTREFSISDKVWLFDRRLQTAASYKVKTNDILETTSNPYNEKTYRINLNFLPGFELPSSMYGFQSILRTNPTTDFDTLSTSIESIDSSSVVWDTTYSYSLQDLRVDFMTTNNLFTINVPIQRDDVSYSVGGTYNSIVGTDRLENKRVAILSTSIDTSVTPWDTTHTRFLSQASRIQLISLVFGARYNNGRKLSLNISNFTNNHIELGKTVLNSASITGVFPLSKDKMSLSGTFSYLSSSGLSEFKNYGLSLGSTIKISNAFRINLSTSTKARSTSEGTEMSNLAVRLSTNYIF